MPDTKLLNYEEARALNRKIRLPFVTSTLESETIMKHISRMDCPGDNRCKCKTEEEKTRE